jgi:hypothetical protein
MQKVPVVTFAAVKSPTPTAIFSQIHLLQPDGILFTSGKINYLINYSAI